jgi:hypothetical protein
VRDGIVPARADHDQVGASARRVLVQALARRRSRDPRNLGGNLGFVPQPGETLESEPLCLVIRPGVGLGRWVTL